MLTVMITELDSASPEFTGQLQNLLAWDETEDFDVHSQVREIIADVVSDGDKAVIAYTNRFDHRQVNSASELELTQASLKSAFAALPTDQAKALQVAAARIRAYAEHQKMLSWDYTEADGTVLGQKITPLDRVGLYVPGGKAAYPSSVLMNAIPAKVAGVGELIMVVPTPKGETNQLVLAAAHLAGVDRIFTIGGAQAIAALAYGTETIPAVAKIVGPGNIYVATAKKMVFGKVGIDMIAGPSENLDYLRWQDQSRLDCNGFIFPSRT
jgi:histidinol dehydrogenase